MTAMERGGGLGEQGAAAAAIAWTPGADLFARSRLLRFMREQGFGPDEYPGFHTWSVRETAAFWDAVMRDLDLQFLKPYTSTVDLSAGPEWPRWFQGGEFNYVHNALDRWANGPEADRECLVWEGDCGAVERWSYSRLLREVVRVAAGLRQLGLEPGDRVGLFLPMTLQTVAALLAVNRIGGVGVPVFSGYGAEAVRQRLTDCGATILITADAFLRRGKRVEMKATADQAVVDAAVRNVVVYRRLGGACPWSPGRDIDWADLGVGAASAPLLRTDPEHPCLILYTSGTTGRPKGAVHPHCGFPVKSAQDLAHLFDLQQGDRLFWYSDLGWMMGPWAIMGALMLGAACVLFEGTPDHPTPGRIWEMVDRHRVTHLGISPTAVRALMARGDEWPGRADLSTLQVLGSSGEPWNELPWRWFLSRVGRNRCPIINYSGGTEISGGILGCVTFRPLKPCGFNAVVPGMDADVLDPDGRPVRNRVGELALRGVWPGMTRGFWRDPARYLETYWSRWPGVWVHGDWALRDDEDHWFILGRSDDTIKVAGKRLGPAEVESAAMGCPGVREAAAIGSPDPVKGERLVLFVVPTDPEIPPDRIEAAARDQVAGVLGPALRPDRVHVVEELPRTRNGKVLRRLLRNAYLREPLGDTGSLENPSSLEGLPHP